MVHFLAYTSQRSNKYSTAVACLLLTSQSDPAQTVMFLHVQGLAMGHSWGENVLFYSI